MSGGGIEGGSGRSPKDHLMSTLTETIEMAAIRLVDPDLLDSTSYAQVLPTLLSALTGEKTMPLLDLKKNILVDRAPGDNTLIHLENFTTLTAIKDVSSKFASYAAVFESYDP